MSYSSYESCPKCAGKAAPGAVALLKVLITKYPYTRSMGIYNCRYIAGTRTLSNHSCGCAIDLGIPVQSGGRARTDLGNPIVQFLDSISTEIGLTEQIYNRVRYDRKSPRGRYYGGAHPHYDHIHLSITKAKGQSLTASYLAGIAGLSTPSTGGDDIMLGLSIGSAGDPVSSDPRGKALQAFLVGQGFDLGDFGPNDDGVDGKPGDVTRKAFHDWKVGKAGITSATSGGDGVVGAYEYAAMLAGGQTAPEGDYADADHDHKATVTVNLK